MKRRALMESLEGRVLLSGVTVIAHGYQLSNIAPSWMSDMANHVSARAGSGAITYKLHIGLTPAGPAVDSFAQISGPLLANSASAERIVLVDWAEATGVGLDFLSDYSADEIAGLIEPYLVRAIPGAGVNQPLAESPIQLIGHSYDSTIGFNSAPGFAWSRLGAGARPGDGVHSGSNTPSGIWDNITILKLKSGLGVDQGDSVSVQTRFLDPNENATLSLQFDSDANPYNGSLSAGAISVENTETGALGDWKTSLSTSDLPPGVYRVFATISNGSRARYYYAPGSVTVTAPVTPTGTITGVVFNDVNANGAKDSTENSGVRAFMYLDLNDNGVYDVGETNHTIYSDAITGSYRIPNLYPGTYVVRQIVPNGYRQTLGGYTVTVAAGQTRAGYDFGDVQVTGAISGVVFNDANGNGAKDHSETTGLRAFTESPISIPELMSSGRSFPMDTARHWADIRSPLPPGRRRREKISATRQSPHQPPARSAAWFSTTRTATE